MSDTETGLFRKETVEQTCRVAVLRTPRERILKRCKKVVDTIGDDHIIVDCHKCANQHHCDANTYKKYVCL